MLELTGGAGAEAVLDFVGEGTAIAAGVAMLRRAGSYYVIGYGGNLDIPTIDVISTEINFVGNLVGTYNDLVELMALAAEGRYTCTPSSTRSRISPRRSTTCTTEGCADVRFWFRTRTSRRPREDYGTCRRESPTITIA